jgi:hypothetical protein
LLQNQSIAFIYSVSSNLTGNTNNDLGLFNNSLGSLKEELSFLTVVN